MLGSQSSGGVTEQRAGVGASTSKCIVKGRRPVGDVGNVGNASEEVRSKVRAMTLMYITRHEPGPVQNHCLVARIICKV